MYTVFPHVEVESVQPMAKLTSLSFVAVVRGQGSTWNSPRCRCDVAVLALLAPALVALVGGEA